MLDIHAPHQTVHTWKDFLVHIAAIAIGLLLALGLEKVAEYIHERRLRTDGRRELAMEVADNRRIFGLNVIEATRIEQELDADLKVIQALRLHAPVGDAKFDYSVTFHATHRRPLAGGSENGSLNLMPYEELQSLAWFHGILSPSWNRCTHSRPRFTLDQQSPQAPRRKSLTSTISMSSPAGQWRPRVGS